MIRRKSCARDYRNEPAPSDWEDFDLVILSARTPRRAIDLAKARGQKIWFWSQPVATRWQGNPVTDFPWDKLIWDICGDSLIKDRHNSVIILSSDGLDGGSFIDFSRPGISMRLAHAQSNFLLSAGADGILLDYATDSLGWFPDMANADVNWTLWKMGYLQYKQLLRSFLPGRPVVMQTNRTASLYDGLALEGINRITPVKFISPLVAGKPNSLIFREVNGPLGVYLSAVSMVHDCYLSMFINGDTRGHESARWDLDLGNPIGEVTTTQTHLIRYYERGFAQYDPSTFSGRILQTSPVEREAT